jgi:small subunit ribosomal protein S8
MATSDTIADMLTRIRNGNRVKMRKVNIKRSKVCLGIARVLKDEGYIRDFVEIDDNNQGEIRVELKYGDRGERVITNLKRESRPGRRVYQGVTEMPRVLDGLGIVVMSTSRGVLSDRQCRQQKVGGEILCTVW